MDRSHSLADVEDVIRVFIECGLVEIHRRNGMDRVRFTNVNDCYDVRERMLEGMVACMRYLSSVSKEPDKALREDDLHHWHDVLMAIAQGYPEFRNNYKKLDMKTVPHIWEWDEYCRKKFAC